MQIHYIVCNDSHVGGGAAFGGAAFIGVGISISAANRPASRLVQEWKKKGGWLLRHLCGLLLDWCRPMPKRFLRRTFLTSQSISLRTDRLPAHCRPENGRKRGPERLAKIALEFEGANKTQRPRSPAHTDRCQHHGTPNRRICL